MLAMMAICLSMPVLTSCSDDDDEPSGDALVEQLQGTWYLEDVTMSVPALDYSVTMTADELIDAAGYDAAYDEVLTFKGNKVIGYDNKEHTYRVSGNRLLLPWYEDDDLWYDVSFSGSNIMTLYVVTDVSGYDCQMWFNYRKSGSRAAVVAPADAQLRSLVKAAIMKAKM